MMLSQLIVILNNFIKYNFTHLIFIKIFYNFKIKELLNFIRIDDLDLNDLIDNDIKFIPQQAPQQITVIASQNISVMSTNTIQSQATPPVTQTISVTISVIEQRAVTIRMPLPKTSATQSVTSSQAILRKITIIEQRAIAIRVLMRKVITRTPGKLSARAIVITTDAFPIDQSEAYRFEHIDAQNAFVFASIRMKEYYNAKHKPMFFKIDDYVHLRLHRDYQIIDVQSRKLDQQFAKSFEIVKRIGRLVYRLKLSSIMKIHNVVSIIYLKSVITIALDSYERHFIISFFIIIDNEEEYEIERLIRKRYRRYERAK